MSAQKLEGKLPACGLSMAALTGREAGFRLCSVQRRSVIGDTGFGGQPFLVQKAGRIIPWQNTIGPVRTKTRISATSAGERPPVRRSSLSRTCSMRATALARMGGTLHKIPVSQAAAVLSRLRSLDIEIPQSRRWILSSANSCPPTPGVFSRDNCSLVHDSATQPSSAPHQSISISAGPNPSRCTRGRSPADPEAWRHQHHPFGRQPSQPTLQARTTPPATPAHTSSRGPRSLKPARARCPPECETRARVDATDARPAIVVATCT